LTPPLIASVMAYWGWRAAFLLSGALTCSVTLWWFQSATDHPADHPRVSAAEMNLMVSHREDDKIRPQLPDVAWFRRILRSREAWLLTASEFSFGVAGFVFATWFYTYLVRVRGAQGIQSAWLSSMPYMAIALGAPLGGFLCDRSARILGAPWGRRLIPLVTIPLSGVALAFAPGIASNTAAAATFALAAGLQYMAAPAFWSTLIDVTRRGAGLLGGVMNGSNYFGSALATALFPLLIATTGWEPALQSVSAAAFLSGLLWLGINSSRQIDQSADGPR